MKNREKIKKEIGQRIKTERTKLSLYQDQLAKILGVERPTISQIESGRNFPSVETLLKLSEVFKVSTDWILTGNTTSFDIEKIEDQEDREFIKTLNILLINNKKLRDALKEEIQYNFQLFGTKK